MITIFTDPEKFAKFRRNNINFVDIRSNFFNGYILRDKNNTITHDDIAKYELSYDNDVMVNTETGIEYTKNENKFVYLYGENFKLKNKQDIIDHLPITKENYNFICLIFIEFLQDDGIME